MRILFYEISYLDYDLLLTFKDMNISYDTFSWKFKKNHEDDEFLCWFRDNFSLSQYDALFSIDYWPLLSILCQESNTPYIAWSYDTPPNVKNIEDTLGNEVNHVFWFDKSQYRHYKKEGFDNVYHLPLGINARRLSSLSASTAEHNKYDIDISLVGKLYDSDYLEYLSIMSPDYQAYMNKLVDTQGMLFDRYIIDEMITPSMMQEINQYFSVLKPGTSFTLPKEALTYALASEVTKRERIILLSLCGARHKTRLYSYQSNEIIKNIEKYPEVNYVTEMPLIFQCSKINLNPAFCMIQSGISLRAIDIMGAGGFLLSRPQEELLEMYDDGKEFVSYSSISDAVDKCDYYLKHDDIRFEIATKGRMKTLVENNLKNRLITIFRTVNL